jgi:hypothetical protein
VYEISAFCHSGKGENPVDPDTSGCRNKSGMTAEGLFTRPSCLRAEALNRFKKMNKKFAGRSQDFF